MSASISVQMDPKSVAAAMAMMRRYATVCHKSEGEAVRFGAEHIARSLAASTRVSKKTRKVKAEMILREAGGAGRGKGWQRGGLQTRWYAIREKGGTSSKLWMPWRVATEDQAKADRRATIGLRGAAKASWYRLLYKGARRGSGQFATATGAASRYADANTRAVQALKSVTPYIEMTNAIGYAEKAFKTRGKTAINSAFDRAARGMSRTIERRLRAAK